MRSVWLTPVVLVVAALVIVAALYLWEKESTPQSQVGGFSVTNSGTYTNPQYGYSISYPSGYGAKQFANVFAEVGQVNGAAFTEKADLAMLSATVKDPSTSFDDFVRLSAQLACGTSGSPSVKCGEIATSSTITTGSGVQGTELYFNSSDGVRGPFFAFNVTRNVPSASYAVLLLYPPSQYAGSNTDEALLRQIAFSVQVK